MEAYADSHALTEVYPGVVDTLKWLKRNGVEMALITNKPERFVAPLLDEMKLGRYFAGSSAATPCRSRSPTRRRCCS